MLIILIRIYTKGGVKIKIHMYVRGSINGYPVS